MSLPLLPRVILDRGGGSVLKRKPKAVIVFPSALIRMNDCLRWSVCQLEKTWLQSGSDKPQCCIVCHCWKAKVTKK